MKAAMIGQLVAVVVINILFTLILAYPVMLLWNISLVPAVSSVSEIGYFQAFGLLILVRVFIDGVKIEAKV